MKTLSWFIYFIFLSPLLFSQKKAYVNVQNAADCKNAVEIFTDRITYTNQIPVGFGALLEFKNNHARSLYYPIQEHNTVWYYFIAPKDGLLSFEIVPQKAEDDCDFLLFSYSGTDFCKDVISKKIRPLRTNLSKGKPEIEGKTGLSFKVKDAYVRAGVGNAYSAAVEVRKDQLFYLLVDNVSEKSGNHYISFRYADQVLSVTGKVMDKEGKKALRATIILEDATTGRTLSETSSDSLSGNFSLDVPSELQKSKRKLSIQVYKDGYFFFDTVFDASQLAEICKIKLSPKIPAIKVGESYSIENILFYAGSAKPLPESYYLYELVYKFLTKNKNLHIEIGGHTNGCPRGSQYSVDLSKQRAKNLVDYLIRKSVRPRRLQAVGHGCSQMIYPEAEALKDESKARANRRVEITILSNEEQ